jgi:hypothetical protein
MRSSQSRRLLLAGLTYSCKGAGTIAGGKGVVAGGRVNAVGNSIPGQGAVTGLRLDSGCLWTRK